MTEYIEFYRNLILHTYEWIVDAFTGRYSFVTIFVVGLLSICLLIHIVAMFLHRVR